MIPNLFPTTPFVSVYWNFHRKCFSVRCNGRVIAHATSLLLREPRFRVSQAGRRRVLEEKRKNVHALIIGYLATPEEVAAYVDSQRHAPKPPRIVSYNPYKNETFVDSTGAPVDREGVALLHVANERGVVATF
jgi:hypothetical protein